MSYHELRVAHDTVEALGGIRVGGHRHRTGWLTPALARQFLAKMRNPMPVRQNLVNRYADAITRDAWIHNGEALIFDGEGYMIEGQHRCLAVIKADKAILTDFVENVTDPRAFASINTGRVREGRDILGAGNFRDSTALSTAARLLCLYRQRRIGAGRTLPVTPQQQLDMLKAEPGLMRSADFVKHHATIGFGRGSLTFLHFVFSESDPDKADAFIDGLKTGESLTRDSPIYLLRERLARRGKRTETLPQTTRLAMAIKAWNAYRTDRTIRILRWHPDEQFPDVL